MWAVSGPIIETPVINRLQIGHRGSADSSDIIE